MPSIMDIYNELNRTYDPDDPRVVGWANEESYNKRVSIVRKYFEPTSTDIVLDYGCGSLLSYYKEFTPKRYVGVDINKESLQIASKYNAVKLVNDLTVGDLDKYGAVLVRNTESIWCYKYTKIVCNGVLQDLSNINEVYNLLYVLNAYLSSDGSIFIITPSNLISRVLDNELLLSPTDLIGIANSLNLGYELSYGELGQHIIMKLYKLRSNK